MRKGEYGAEGTREAQGESNATALPRSIALLVENAGRNGDPDGRVAKAAADWLAGRGIGCELEIMPARILMQDTAGIAALVDLAALRDFAAEAGADRARVEPQIPIDLVIDHSVVADHAGGSDAFARNMELEFSRNAERYGFFRWAENAFRTLRIVPPGNGICHQINLERLAQVATRRSDGTMAGEVVIGTDSHTTMINALGVMGWGVGGMDAEAVSLGQPLTVSLPRVTGVRLTGNRKPGVTATDLALTMTSVLRQLGVVGDFVEFFGNGLDSLTIADRATLANMAPEYGATCALFPVDEETLGYLLQTGREPSHVLDVERYARQSGLWRDDTAERAYSRIIDFALDTVGPVVAGPGRPHELNSPATVSSRYTAAPATDASIPAGAVAIAAITSCTNTANPHLLIAAGLACRNARRLGLAAKPWVKTSFSPGSRATAQLLQRAGLQEELDALGFQITGYGCMTCVGNSGPLKPEMTAYLDGGGTEACAVLSGNRNFQYRIHNRIADNYLASPAMVVAYALAGTMALDIAADPIGTRPDGTPIYLADIMPSDAETDAVFRAFQGDPKAAASDWIRDPLWQKIDVAAGERFRWDLESAAIRRPPFFDMPGRSVLTDITDASPLLVLGDNVTTDHISPIGTISSGMSADAWLMSRAGKAAGLKSYGACRGNHDVMMRGTFNHPGLQNALAKGKTGPWTTTAGTDELLEIFAAAEQYAEKKVPLVVFAGANYGMGSARDWAAKGTLLLGVKAVIAQSFERIHRANLAGVGVLPLQLPEGVTSQSLGVTSESRVSLSGLETARETGGQVLMTIDTPRAGRKEVPLTLRLDTRREFDVAEKGGLFAVARSLVAGTDANPEN